jgi:hypothetical protein
MKNLLIILLFVTSLGYSQIPTTINPMALVKTVTGPDCYFSNTQVSAYITGGVPPFQYKWSRKIYGVTTLLQDYMNAPLVYDMLFPQFDRYGVDLLTEQPQMGPTSQLFTLTVLDSHVESTNPLNPDLHDTLTVSFNIQWPQQIILPMYVTPEPSTYTISGLPIYGKYNNGLPHCDTCPGEYLVIRPELGTDPYNILFIGTDNLGNHVEYYGYNCQALHITNLAQLHAGCYQIYVTDNNGCQESFNYCYTTTGIEELTLERKVIKITDLMGKECLPQTNKILIYHYSDNSTDKVFVSEI